MTASIRVCSLLSLILVVCFAACVPPEDGSQTTRIKPNLPKVITPGVADPPEDEAERLAYSKGLVKELLAELDALRKKKEFSEFYFSAQNEPANEWLTKVDSLLYDSRFSMLEKACFGYVSTLAKEYIRTENKETRSTKELRAIALDINHMPK